MNSTVCGLIGASAAVKSARTLKKYLENVRGSSPGTINASAAAFDRRAISAGVSSSVTHTPERSGLPSAARGAFAARSTLPFGSRGTPGSGWFNHCARVSTPVIAASMHANTSPFGRSDMTHYSTVRSRDGQSNPIAAHGTLVTVQ